MNRVWYVSVAFFVVTLAMTNEAEAIGSCASGETLYGIDVDKFSGLIDWPAVAADGVKFAYIRVAAGLTSDFNFAENWNNAGQTGIVRGVEQVLYPAEDALEQAKLLVDAVGQLEPGDLPPALAVERIDGQSGAVIAAKVGIWAAHVESELGLQPVIYTGRFFWEDSVSSSDYTDHPLWIAHYSTVTCPGLPSEWTDWALWQFSSTEPVEGINGSVNSNWFNGGEAELSAFGKQRELGPLILEDGFEEPVKSPGTLH